MYWEWLCCVVWLGFCIVWLFSVFVCCLLYLIVCEDVLNLFLVLVMVVWL